jgi:hypothetical protein
VQRGGFVVSQIEPAVAEKLQKRAEAGLAKYGVTMERTDLSRLDWLIHAQEEAMDLAVYLERLIQDERIKSFEISVGDIVEVIASQGIAEQGDIGRVMEIYHDSPGIHKILYRVKCQSIEFWMNPENLKNVGSKV